MLVRQIKNYKLILAISPRAGVNTVDNFIRRLEPNKHPRKHFWYRKNDIPNGFWAVKFVRNPYARAVSQFIMYATQNKENAKMTFVEFLNYLGTINMHTCDPHYGYQHKYIDNKFEIFKIEEFGKFIEKFNEFGNHKFSINEVHAGNTKPKISFAKKAYDISYKDLFDMCNSDDDVFIAGRKQRSPEFYYLGIEPHFNIPSYFSFYNDDVKQIVYKLFRTDIENFGYTFDEIIEVNHPQDLITMCAK